MCTICWWLLRNCCVGHRKLRRAKQRLDLPAVSGEIMPSVPGIKLHKYMQVHDMLGLILIAVYCLAIMSVFDSVWLKRLFFCRLDELACNIKSFVK